MDFGSLSGWLAFGIIAGIARHPPEEKMKTSSVFGETTSTDCAERGPAVGVSSPKI